MAQMQYNPFFVPGQGQGGMQGSMQMQGMPMQGQGMPMHPAMMQQRMMMMGGEVIPMRNITEPREVDVLCGRGGAALRHPGNQTYRRLVNMNKPIYTTCLKNEKLKISRSIVAAIREQRGRFLERDGNCGTWYDIGDKKAVEKTSQALREGQPKLRQKMADEAGDKGKEGQVPTISLAEQFANGMVPGVPKTGSPEATTSGGSNGGSGSGGGSGTGGGAGGASPAPVSSAVISSPTPPPRSASSGAAEQNVRNFPNAPPLMQMTRSPVRPSPSAASQATMMAQHQQMMAQQQQMNNMAAQQQQMNTMVAQTNQAAHQQMNNMAAQANQELSERMMQSLSLTNAAAALAQPNTRAQSFTAQGSVVQLAQPNAAKSHSFTGPMGGDPAAAAMAPPPDVKVEEHRGLSMAQRQLEEKERKIKEQQRQLEEQQMQLKRQQEQLRREKEEHHHATLQQGNHSNMGTGQNRDGARMSFPGQPTSNSHDPHHQHQYDTDFLPGGRSNMKNSSPFRQEPIKKETSPSSGGSAGQPPRAPASGNSNEKSDAVAVPKLDRRRLFARMKYNRPASGRAHKPSNKSTTSLGKDLPDIHMVDSNFSLMSGMSSAMGSRGSLSLKDDDEDDGRPRSRGASSGGDDDNANMLISRRTMNTGSRRSMMSGISDYSEGNSIFSDLSKKIGNVSTRSIAMSEISGIEEGQHEDIDESFHFPDPPRFPDPPNQEQEEAGSVGSAGSPRPSSGQLQHMHNSLRSGSDTSSLNF